VARQPSIRVRPALVAQMGEDTPWWTISSSARIEWISICLASSFDSLPRSISEVTNAMARISRISDELKLTSLSRLRISAAVRGQPRRTMGLRCTITTSRESQS
jgi:hypothetical protein